MNPRDPSNHLTISLGQRLLGAVSLFVVVALVVASGADGIAALRMVRPEVLVPFSAPARLACAPATPYARTQPGLSAVGIRDARLALAPDPESAAGRPASNAWTPRQAAHQGRTALPPPARV